MKKFILLVWVLGIVGCNPNGPVASKDAGIVNTPVAIDDPLESKLENIRNRNNHVQETKDTRTAKELHIAGCTTAKGEWRCKDKQPVVLAAGASPILPISWTVPAWFIDPSNVSTTASDANDCITSVTPCLTWQEINIHRWNCIGNPTACPRLRQTTVITFMSDQTTNADPFNLDLSIENAAIVSVVGSLGASQQIVTGVLAGVVLATRSPVQLTNATLGAGVAIGSLVVNSTHPSRSWVYKNVAGATWAMSQPITPQVIPGSIQPAEVNTWANGDTYTAYNPVKVFVTHLGAAVAGWNASFNNNLYVNSISFFSVNGVVGEESKIDPVYGDVNITESQINRSISNESTSYISSAFNNCAFMAIAGVKAGGTPNLTKLFNGGFFLGGATLANVNFGGDIIIASATSINGSLNGYSTVYIETATTVNYKTTGSVTPQAVSGGPIIWGPGTLNVSGTTRFLYTSTAVAHLLVTNLQLNGGTTAHSLFTLANVDTPCGGITVNPTALDLASSATCATTGFGGLAFNPGGAAYVAGAQ